MKKEKSFFGKSVLTVLWISLCFACPGRAEETAVLPGTGVPPVMDQRAPAEPVPEIKAERTEEGKYYLDFKGAALINVLNVLSNLSGINFVTGSEVAERSVNMTLDNVGLEDVLQSIAYGSNVNYDFLPGRNIYLFRAGADSPEKPTLMTRVFKLYYVKVTKLKEIDSGSSSSGSSGSSGGGLTTLKAPDEEGSLDGSAIVKTVEKILSDRGKVSVDDRSNSLIVTDAEDRLKMIELAIAQLDRPLDQVLINVLLVETYEDLDRNLGVEWGDSNGVFATITGAKETTEWPFRTGSVPTNGSIGDFFGNIGNTFKDTAKQFNPTNSSGPVPTDTNLGMRDFSSFQIKVKALESASKLKILAKPKILALDNQPALIKISTQTAIGTADQITGGGADVTTNTQAAERYETGTVLRVTPLINTGGRITLTVEPTFATVDPSAISVGGNESLDPTVRTARTTLMVNDGQTIALGGMLFSHQSNGDRKVPFFGNIPVIGKALFTSNEKSLRDRELILFVTPYIITDPSLLETPKAPDRRLYFDDEVAPFWKVKQKEWYKELKEGPEKKTDFDAYFDVRRNLIDSTLDTLDQSAKSSVQGRK